MEIVCILASLERLGVTSVSCSPLPFFNGLFNTIPSAITAELLIGMPTYPGTPEGISPEQEVLSPFVAALLRVLTGVASGDKVKMPAVFVPHKIGYGMEQQRPSACRLTLGECPGTEKRHQTDLTLDASSAASPWKIDTFTHLEANLDDITAEALAFAVEMLLEKGAVDAWVAPIVMKKGRAANTLHCLCHSSPESQTNQLLEIIFRQTTTLGIRIHRNVERAALRRSFVSVTTPFDADKSVVDVKVGYLGDEVVSVKPEFDHCQKISKSSGVPLKRISDFATSEAYKKLLELDQNELDS